MKHYCYPEAPYKAHPNKYTLLPPNETGVHMPCQWVLAPASSMGSMRPKK